MLKKIAVHNFKKLEAEIELGSSVVFVGPNNSGKTSALQAISLWELGMRKWFDKRKKSTAKERTAATLNRRDILFAPTPSAIQLWKDTDVRKGFYSKGRRGTEKIKMEIDVHGLTGGKNWRLGLEFDYANPESIYCRGTHAENNGESCEFPEMALSERVGFLPPMSGLSSREDKLEMGSIQTRIGQGLTAEVIRNLCWIVYDEKHEKWKQLEENMENLFNIKIDSPLYDPAIGQITMTYREHKNKLDLSCAGRGFHQILLILSYIYANQSTILLIDEPDAHLEIIRQAEIYNLLSEIVKKENSQLIIATHSERVLNEAAGKDTVVAFLGKPHVVNNKSQLVKSLTTIGFDQYLLAEQKKCVLYLEGSTDLSMLKAFAKVLNHPMRDLLDKIFVKYTSNNPPDARSHFNSLREALPSLKGLAIFDHMDKALQESGKLHEMMWKRREIENYLPIPEVLLRYVESESTPLFKSQELDLINRLIHDYIPPVALKNKTDDRWWFKTKMSDDFLDTVFRKYFEHLGMRVSMDKGSYYKLALLAKSDELNPEIKEKLDAIWNMFNSIKNTNSDSHED